MGEIWDADAMRIKEIILNQEMSVTEVTSKYIERVKAKNPSINFLTEDRFEAAMEEASKADDALSNGNVNGRLFGVPISMKESFDVKGMPTTGGLLRRRGLIQKQDAEVVRKLRAEGAIIIGKTNTPELCFCQETDNKLYGRTNNPWNIERTAGGSSGGEGAAIAIGAAAVGLGSDIGGSIRFPSHFNGVIGFKSGQGQVSQAGSFPYVEDAWQQRMLGIGPMAKSVRDARLVYTIIADHAFEERNLDEFSINVFQNSKIPLSSESSSRFNEVFLTLRESYTTVREQIPLLEQSALLWQEIMSIDGGAATRKIAFGNENGSPLTAYVREITNRNADIHRYLSWALIGALLFKPSSKRISEIAHILKEGDELLNQYLERRLIVMPVYHTAAPIHGKVYKEIFSIKKTFLKYMPFVAYANTWGLPALTVPIGVDSDGMPIGIQIIGKNGNEDAIFSLGTFLEEHYGGYTGVD